MADKKSLSELRKLPRKDLEKVVKGDIIDSILSSSDADIGVLGRVEARLETLSKEVVALREAYTQAEQASEKRISDLQARFDKQGEIILSQQLFLENIDRKQREKHLILLGVPEGQDALEGVTDDVEKIKKIWTTIGVNEVDVVSQKRLGRDPVRDRKRPILLILNLREDREKVLEKAKVLKEKSEAYKTIYVKKDVHPAVRREWKRLYEAETAEKARAENRGHTIRFDTRARKL